MRGSRRCSAASRRARRSTTRSMASATAGRCSTPWRPAVLRGVVAKSAVARYYGGERSTAWYKIKAVKRQEFVVIGWRPPDYGDVDVRGLFLGTYEDGELVYRGGVGTGLSDRDRIELRQVLGLLESKRRPAIKGMPKPEMRGARWVEPRLLCEVL